MRFHTRLFVATLIASSSLSLITGCGSSPSSGSSGGGGSTVTPTATYIYSLQQTSPETVIRFAAAGSGSVTPSATTTLPTGFTASDIKVDSSSNLYVTGYTSSSVPEILVYSSGATTPSRTLTLSAGGPLAVDSSGNMYVVNATSTSIVVSEYAAGTTGGFAMALKTFTYSTPYQIAEDIALDSSNNVYVAVTSSVLQTGSVFQFTSTASNTATPTRTLALTGYTYGLGVDGSGNVYVSSTTLTTPQTGTIEVFGTTGTSPTRTIVPPVGSYSAMGGVKADSAGYAYAVFASYPTSTSSSPNVSLIAMSPTQSGSVTPTYAETSTSLGVNTNYQIALR